MKYTDLDIDLLKRHPLLARRRPEKVSAEEIAQVRLYGFIHPVIVRQTAVGIQAEYEILSSERSWFLAQAMQINAVPAVIHQDLSDSDADNLVRISIGNTDPLLTETGNPMQDARAIKLLLEREPDLKLARLAREMGKDRAEVTRLLNLLTLEKPVQALVEKKLLSLGQTRSLAGMLPNDQIELARLIVNNELSVRRIEKIRRLYNVKSNRTRSISELNEIAKNTAIKARNASTTKTEHAQATNHTVLEKDPAVIKYEEKITEGLGNKASLEEGRKKDGLLKIRFSSKSELEGIVEKLTFDSTKREVIFSYKNYDELHKILTKVIKKDED